MAEYRVVWEIDVDADSDREAAEAACRMMQRHGTQAVVFGVRRRHEPEILMRVVDLLDEEVTNEGVVPVKG